MQRIHRWLSLANLPELSFRERLLLKIGVKSCLDCGYLAESKWVAELPEPRQYDEAILKVRRALRTNESYGPLQMLCCLRHVWHYDEETVTVEQLATVRGPRFCGRFYPYTQGLPSEHVESHRSRTNRRWLVAGGLLGPYIATMLGFAVGRISNNASFPIALIVGAICGLVGLAVAAMVINLTLNRI